MDRLLVQDPRMGSARASSKSARSKTVDPASVIAGMKRLMPLVRKLPATERRSAAELKSIALGGPAVVRSKNKRIEEGPVIYSGDLEIAGSFDFGTVVMVLGDLTVQGVIQEIWDGASLLVAGSITARGIKCGGRILAAGPIRTEVVFVELGGALGSGRGIAADLAILEDPSIKLAGRLRAKKKLVLRHPDTRPLERLETLLARPAFGVIRGHDGIFDYTNLFSVLRRGRPWANRARR
jgi:hypothetical protein